MRVRRSLAFCKAIAPEEVQLLIDSNVDSIVLDLEDGVVATRKSENRVATAELLKTWDFKGKERVLRVNSPDSPYYDLDIEEVVKIGLPDAIRLPKCDTAEYVLKVSKDLDNIENELGIPKNSIEMILMIESPLGIMNTYEMCTCSKRVTAVGVGMEDLTAAMGILRRYELNCPDLLFARQKMILEAKAAGVQAIDSGVLLDADPDYIYQESLIDRQMGFDGRSCSSKYMRHIDFVNKAFTPSEEEMAWAEKVIEAYDKAVASGNSDVYVEGKFVDPPVVLKAQNLLDMMSQIRNRQ